MMQSNVTSKGQVTIPASIRKQLGIKPGGKVAFRLRGKETVLVAVDDPPISSLFGILGKPPKRVKNVDAAIEAAWNSRADQLMKNRR